MAEPEANAESAAPAKKGKLKGLLVMGLVVLVCGFAGFFVPYVFPAAFGLDPEILSKPEAVPPDFVSFGDIVVNLDEGRLNRYLRVKLTLQVPSSDTDEVEAALEKHRSILKNWLLSYLGDKSMDDIRGAAGQNRLRREIQDYFNTVLSVGDDERVQDVLFEEFNIQ
jgi:flagellar basal body-associated protein FliL